MESSFPSLLSRWLEGILGGSIPAESGTTCGSCPLRTAEAAEVRFHPETKCCTFFPEIPSYSVGGIFLDEHPDMERARDFMRKRIALGQQVTPLGVGRPVAYQVVYEHSAGFGVDRSMRCPYYIDEGAGLCGVWRHRESTCAAWFCKHERGKVGLEFWGHIRRLLKALEYRLAYVVGLELGVHRGALDAMIDATVTLHRDLDPEYYAGIWRPWAGREIEYFEACARRVAELDWPAVRALCGPVLDRLLAAAEEAHVSLRQGPQLPDLVRIRPLRRVGKLGDTTTLKTYSAYDAIVVPDRVIAGLVQHDVATVGELCAEPGVDRPLLEKMLDAGLLEDGAE